MAENEIIKEIMKNLPSDKISETNFEVCVKEPPVKGQANTAIIMALAKHFGVRFSEVKIISGHTSRQKIIEIKK